MSSTANALTAETLAVYSDQIKEYINKSMFFGKMLQHRPEPPVFKPMPMTIPRTNAATLPIYTKDFEYSRKMLPMASAPKVQIPPVTTLFGYRLMEHESCVIRHPVQVHFPRSKKKRIRKKWAARPVNFKIEREYKCYVLEPQKTTFVPPGFRDKIIKAAMEQGLS